MFSISLPIAFLAGLLSFFSPCILPLIPSYIAYITNLSLTELTTGIDQARIRKLAVYNSLLFILGFSLVFIALGASASLIGHLLIQHRSLIRIGGGVLIIFLGLYSLGFFKLGLLDFERKFQVKFTSKGYRRSILIGMIFAAAWTPCVGPILATILTLAGASKTLGEGIGLLAAYSIGLGIPFLLTSLAINTFMLYFKRFHIYLWAINLISGVFLILIGILLITDFFSILVYNF